jgi:membrane fusion protein, multidrug efflux system
MVDGQKNQLSFRKARNYRALVPAIALGAGLLPAGLAGCKEEAAIVDRPVPVRVATVQLEPLSSTRRYTGVIRPRFESDLGFRVAGKVVERKVNVGDRVKAGDVIARLDDTDFKLSVEAQEAELNAAKSNRDEAVAAEGRYKILKTKGWVAQSGLDTKTAAADEARARVERAKRTLDTQRNQVAYTELRADREGVVSALPAETGQVVAAGQTIARVARLDELEAVVAIPEQKIDEVKSASAAVELWPATGKKYPVKLRE